MNEAGTRAGAREALGALLLGLVAAAVGTALWFVVRNTPVLRSGWLAPFVGLLIGFGVLVGAGRRHRWWLSLMALVLAFLASVASQNFVQRDSLLDGIDGLQARWATLRVDSKAAKAVNDPSSATTPTTVVTTSSTTPPTLPDGSPAPTAPPGIEVPPPEIAKVLPAPALDLMKAENLAVVWQYVPDATRAQVRPDLRQAVEDLLNQQQNDAEAAQRLAEARSKLDASKADFESANVPKPVLVCAQQPDFTQPNAAAGLGFPDGVPWFLPASDLYTERVRGDGLDLPAPSPVCFARETVKDRPLEAALWGAGAVLALLIPSPLLGRRRRDDDPNSGPMVGSAPGPRGVA